MVSPCVRCRRADGKAGNVVTVHCQAPRATASLAWRVMYAAYSSLDVAKPKEIAAAAAQAKDFTLLINNAGISGLSGDEGSSINVDTLRRLDTASAMRTCSLGRACCWWCLQDPSRR